MPTASPDQTPPPGAALTQLVFGFSVSMSLSAAAKLRLADKLAEGPQSVADLARTTKTHAPSLYRMLRALASVGVFVEQPDGRFAQTPMSELLRTGVRGSLRGIADFSGSEWSWKAWGAFLHSIRTGETAFDHVFGEPCFDYLAKHPDESAVFNEAMTGFSSNDAPAVAEAYDFSKFGTVVDVGGGHGVLLTTILKAFTTVRGVVYDAPHVVEGAKEAIRAAGLADRCRTEGGDFFKAVPAGGDAYLMKHIIHDWPDDRATTILKNCRKAVNPGGKLLLVEAVIKPGNEPDLGKLIDLEMLVLPSGRERTEVEYAKLFAGAGWRLTRVVPTNSPMQVVEGEPV
ncbi:MAG TPA: methyltransferase [Fimbriiglobus sp.]|nr:methyltransferase [Fimbriiglobus sp.]